MNKSESATLFEGIAVAFIFSLITSLAYFSLSVIFSDDFLTRLFISLLGLSYVLYLLSRSQEKTGRFIVVLSWLLIVLSLWILKAPILLSALIQLAGIWLVRSLYFYNSLVSAVFDLALQFLSISVAYWAASHSENLFLTLLCFFLTQALFVLIPAGVSKNSENKPSVSNHRENFHHAYQVAETAVRQLSTHK